MEIRRMWELKKEVEDLKMRLSEICDALKHLTPTLDGLPKSKTIDDRVGKFIALKIDTESRIEKLQAEMEMTAAEITAEIAMSPLKHTEREIMRRRYVDLKNWQIIAQELCYSEMHCYTLHRQALKKMSAT